jgi:hypothetical protein
LISHLLSAGLDGALRRILARLSSHSLPGRLRDVWRRALSRL